MLAKIQKSRSVFSPALAGVSKASSVLFSSQEKGANPSKRGASAQDNLQNFELVFGLKRKGGAHQSHHHKQAPEPEKKSYLTEEQRKKAEADCLKPISHSDAHLAAMNDTPQYTFMRKFADDFKKTNEANVDLIGKYDKELGVDDVPSSKLLIDKKAELEYKQILATRDFLMLDEDGKMDEEDDTLMEDDDIKENIHFLRTESLYEDENDLKFYPGSNKGPHPENDPDAYAQWLYDNLSRTNKRILEEGGRDAYGLPPDESDSQNHESFYSSATGFMSGVLNSEIPFHNPHQEMLNQEKVSIYSDPESALVSFIPEKFPGTWEDGSHVIEKWLLFRDFPEAMNYFSTITDPDAFCQSKPVDFDEVAKMNPDSFAPRGTLFRYYNTLPEETKKSPLVINGLRHMEFNKPDMSLKEKEKALNFLASFTLPMKPSKSL